MEAADTGAADRSSRRVSNGEVVEGTIVQIGAENVFVDIGGRAEGRIERHELADDAGQLKVRVGDRVRATVVDASAAGGPQLSVALGKGGGAGVDVRALEAAMAGSLPVEGSFTKAVKGGLEVTVGGVRAFCPASQVDIRFSEDLESWVGSTHSFRVLEVRDEGRSVVVSRRAQLEAERAEQAKQTLEQLKPGAILEGTVHSIQKFGAIVDIGGIEGLVHISELAHQRVDQVEDIVTVGESVRVQVLSVEESKKGPRIRLSRKALEQAPPGAVPPGRDEVLTAEVTKLVGGGVTVKTEKGEGFVPVRELELPPGSDFRRAYPVGHQLQVVLLKRDAGGKLRFTAKGVDRVLERKNYRDYKGEAKAGKSGGMGSLGELLRQKLNLPEPEPEPEPEPAAPAPAPQRSAPAPVNAAPPPPAQPAAKPAPEPPRERRPDPPGIVRRKKKD